MAALMQTMCAVLNSRRASAQPGGDEQRARAVERGVERGELGDRHARAGRPARPASSASIRASSAPCRAAIARQERYIINPSPLRSATIMKIMKKMLSPKPTLAPLSGGMRPSAPGIWFCLQPGARLRGGLDKKQRCAQRPGSAASPSRNGGCFHGKVSFNLHDAGGASSADAHSLGAGRFAQQLAHPGEDLPGRLPSLGVPSGIVTS